MRWKNIFVREEVHEELRVEAFRRRISMGQLITLAWNKFKRKPKK